MGMALLRKELIIRVHTKRFRIYYTYILLPVP